MNWMVLLARRRWCGQPVWASVAGLMGAVLRPSACWWPLLSYCHMSLKTREAIGEAGDGGIEQDPRRDLLFRRRRTIPFQPGAPANNLSAFSFRF